MATGWPEQVPGLVMMAMECAGQPTSDLSLRFHIILPSDALSLSFPRILGPRTLSLGACAAKSSRGE